MLRPDQVLSPDYSTLLPSVQLINPVTGQVTHTGCGRIWREGGIYAFHGAFGKRPLSEFFAGLELKPGEIIPANHYVRIVGRLPSGEMVCMPNAVRSFFGNLSGELELAHRSRSLWLNSDRGWPEQAARMILEFHFHFDLLSWIRTPDSDLSARGTGFDIAIGSLNTLIYIQDGRLVVHVESGELFSPAEVARGVSRVLGLFLGSEVWFDVGWIGSKDEEVSVVNGSEKAWSATCSGILGSGRGCSQSFLKIFPGAMSLATSQNTSYSDLFAYVDVVHAARRRTVEEYVMACARAVEFALKVAGDCGAVGIGAEDYEAIQKCIKKLELSSELVLQRLRGAISRMKSPSVADKLVFLAKSGVLLAEAPGAFKDARHRIAHGDLCDSQSTYAMFGSAEILRDTFYRIVLYIIGYEGPMVCYGQKGHPVVRVQLGRSLPRIQHCHEGLLGDVDRAD